MWFARCDDGFVIGGLVRDDIETLRGVPMLVESNDERVRRRLLPETYQDDDAEEEWRRHATPELERLFLSRAQIVRKDLANIQRLKAADSWVVRIGDHHVNAWLASLNAARLALYVMAELTERQMERDVSTACTTKQREALGRIHFLAELQCVLLGDIDLADEDDEELGEAGDGGWTIGRPPGPGQVERDEDGGESSTAEH